MSVQLARRLVLSMIMIIENMTLYVDNKLVFNAHIQDYSTLLRIIIHESDQLLLTSTSTCD